MFDPYFHYTQMDDESDGPPFSFAGTHSNPGYHTLGRTRYPLIHQASHAASAVSPEFRRNVFLPEDWQAVDPGFTWGTDSVARCRSPPHFGYSSSSASPLIHEDHRQTVAMPTPNGNAQYDDGLMDTHAYHYGPSFGLVYDNCMAKDPPAIPSPTIPMPIVRTYTGEGALSYVGPTLSSDPTSPCYHTTSYQHVSPPDSTFSPSPCGNFDLSSYSSTSSPPSSIGQSPVAPLTNMSDQIQPQSITTASFDQEYTITVSLETIAFPPVPNVWELPFFKCCWEDCGIWITCEHDAVKHHLARVHDVALKENTDDPIRCKWAHCSSSSKRSGMVRHLHTHFRLRWLCSVCSATYTRPDSVRSHASGKRCEKLAQPISYPSEMAYSARRNGDGTVTLTKIVQP
ncbi:hypothetical protein JVT61DRAFT_775 [Boletus reticuloceps]|uniref:C2H2-type domain-containing protein n=1 Tax=Boletus reticuloceps TaxID=495285 RepID=A0A8I2Z3X7_9AGAM|nr:hypothetical protein JVT61DRAFT_775 [Boletus reticuloceps]